MADEFSQYDGARRRGVFDKCNGRAPAFIRDEEDAFITAYFDGYDANEVKIGEPQPEEIEIEFTPEKLTPLYFCNTGDDLIEGVFDAEGNLLGAWSPNDANWRSEYFTPFMRELGFDCRDGWAYDDQLRRHAIELWGLTEEDVGITE